MRSLLIQLANLALFLIFCIGLAIFLFWRFGVLKQEAQLGKEAQELQRRIEFIQSYSYENLNQYLKKLPKTKIEIPQISPQEIGRSKLF